MQFPYQMAQCKHEMHWRRQQPVNRRASYVIWRLVAASALPIKLHLLIYESAFNCSALSDFINRKLALRFLARPLSLFGLSTYRMHFIALHWFDFGFWFRLTLCSKSLIAFWMNRWFTPIVVSAECEYWHTMHGLLLMSTILHITRDAHITPIGKLVKMNFSTCMALIEHRSFNWLAIRYKAKCVFTSLRSSWCCTHCNQRPIEFRHSNWHVNSNL